MERKWYKGDTHLHTINSDGILTKGQLVEACKKKGLDFMIITDHNFNSVDKSYYDGDILVIQGQELTDELGHVNVWGKTVPEEPPYKMDTAEDYARLIDACKKAGAVVSVNHPFCTNCGFRLKLEDYPFDCVEVWNTIQHSDNMKNRDWWVEQLLQGKRIGAVGGSDYHKDVAKLPLLAIPTTIVHAKSNSEKDILDAMVEGRSVVTNSPDSTMIYLKCGDAQIGDTVRLADNQKLEISVTDMKKGHTLKIFNNDKLIFENTAKSNTKMYMTTVDIKEAGFVRAEVTYEFSAITKKLYTAIESKFLKASGSVPEFIWAFTNPIWVE